MRSWTVAALLVCRCGGGVQPVATVQPVTLPPAPDAGPAVARALPEPKRNVLADCTAPNVGALFTEAKFKPIALTPDQTAQVANTSADPEAAFARARSYFEARHWDEAALAFRPLALDPNAGDISVYAAMLYLEALNVMGSHGRTSCYDQMEIDVPAIRDNCCNGPNAQADQCDIITRIGGDLQRLRNEKK